MQTGPQRKKALTLTTSPNSLARGRAHISIKSRVIVVSEHYYNMEFS